MPRRAKMTMKRKRSNKSDAIDWIELSRDATRLERERQYLCAIIVPAIPSGLVTSI